MQRLGLILLGMASLVASGVILDRGQQMGMQGIQGMSGINMGPAMTREELIRQKLILDVLHQVHLPLQQHDLLMLDDRSIITKEDRYMQPLTQEMHMVLNMLRNHEMLSKENTCSLLNDNHLQQMIGLYRLMVTAQDFDTLLRLMVHARQNINTEMFVNCLVLALQERDDTRSLIIPKLHEILPQIFHNQKVVNQVRNLDTGVSSLKPQLMDVMGTKQQQQQQQGLWNSDVSGMPQGLMGGVMNRLQMWMPWREMHKQLAWRRMMERRNPMMRSQLNMGQQMDMNRGNMDLTQTTKDKVVISVQGEGLLSQDMHLKSHLNLLIDELIVNQDKIKNSKGNERQGWGVRSGIKGLDYDDDNTESDWFTRNQWRHSRNIEEDDDRMNLKHAMDRNRVMMGGRRRMNTNNNNNNNNVNDMWHMSDVDNDDVMTNQRRNPWNMDNERTMTRNWNKGWGNMRNEQPGVQTVNLDEARLLKTGQRSKNPNRVVTLGGHTNNWNVDERDMISGGSRVSKDEDLNRLWQDDDKDMEMMNIRNTKNLAWNTEDDINRSWNNVNIKTGGQSWTKMSGQRRTNNWNDDERDTISGARRVSKGEDLDRLWQDDDDMERINMINTKNLRWNTEDDINRSWDNVNVNTREQGWTKNMGRGRNDFLNVVHMRDTNNDDMMTNQKRNPWNMDNERLTNRNWNMGRGNMHNEQPGIQTVSLDQARLLVSGQRSKNPNRVITLGSRTNNWNDDEQDSISTGQMPWTRRSGQQNWQRNNLNQITDNRWNKDLSNGQRHKRSLMHNIDQDNTQTGKLLVHTLQQLVARLNVERISLGVPQLIEVLENTQMQHMRSRQEITTIQHQTMHSVDVHYVQNIENILQGLHQVMQQRIQEISHLRSNEKINEIGLMLAGQMEEVGLIELIREVLPQPIRKGHVANLLDHEAVQMLLAGIVKVIDQTMQQVGKQNQETLTNTLKGVTIHNVDVDKLETHMELVEHDLSNMMVHEQTQQVVGHMPRLNHKSFKIQMDVSSQNPQKVMVRHLLMPKVDDQGRSLPLRERRQNVIVIGVQKVQLQSGHNTITLKSRDCTLTTRDTTPLTKIYQMVMQALNGNLQLHKQNVIGQTHLLPHHLLLPRGRTNGLVMQLLTVITPVDRTNDMIMSNHMNGLDVLLNDHLPINYPLHGDLNDVEKIMSMSNILVKDVVIYHNDHMQMNIN
ncbi:fat-body protein 1-like [Cochliomyia hominivorax]